MERGGGKGGDSVIDFSPKDLGLKVLGIQWSDLSIRKNCLFAVGCCTKQNFSWNIFSGRT